jgi:uncharacterized membrane protein
LDGAVVELPHAISAIGIAARIVGRSFLHDCLISIASSLTELCGIREEKSMEEMRHSALSLSAAT